jgi:hypothetical protein
MAQLAFSHAVAGGIDLSGLDSNGDGFIDADEQATLPGR